VRSRACRAGSASPATQSHQHDVGRQYNHLSALEWSIQSHARLGRRAFVSGEVGRVPGSWDPDRRCCCAPAERPASPQGWWPACAARPSPARSASGRSPRRCGIPPAGGRASVGATWSCAAPQLLGPCLSWPGGRCPERAPCARRSARFQRQCTIVRPPSRRSAVGVVDAGIKVGGRSPPRERRWVGLRLPRAVADALLQRETASRLATARVPTGVLARRAGGAGGKGTTSHRLGGGERGVGEGTMGELLGGGTGDDRGCSASPHPCSPSVDHLHLVGGSRESLWRWRTAAY
jgi:hypothetical protein